jgi:hypothetical protein
LVKAGQFYKGMINGVEDTYESPDILQILPSDKLAELWDMERPGTYSRVFLSDRVIAKTVVTKAVPDSYGRDGIVNHTVLYKLDKQTTICGATYNFDAEQFKADALAGKYKQLKMPAVPELKHPLDAPALLEV